MYVILSFLVAALEKKKNTDDINFNTVLNPIFQNIIFPIYHQFKTLSMGFEFFKFLKPSMYFTLMVRLTLN